MRVALFLVVAFLVVPILEIYVIIQVGQAIGALPTVVLLVFESLLGAWLIKREGRRAWRALREGAQTGRLPARELTDAGLVLVGGTLLLTPGFVTDVFGFFFVLPFTRPLARRLLGYLVARRAARGLAQMSGGAGPTWRVRPDGRVVEGDVLPPARGEGPGPGPDRGPGRVAGG
jgi:UPF0716 protein FxsA